MRKSDEPPIERRLPLAEERLSVDKQVREGDTVRVTRRPVEEERAIEAMLRKERVRVTRVPRGEVVETAPEIEEHEDRLVVPVVEERLVVRRELVLVEEIHVVREVRREPVTQTATVRRTEVDIERDREAAQAHRS